MPPMYPNTKFRLRQFSFMGVCFEWVSENSSTLYYGHNVARSLNNLLAISLRSNKSNANISFHDDFLRCAGLIV